MTSGSGNGRPRANVLREFYARLDGISPGDPLELFAEDLEVVLTRPGLTPAAVTGDKSDLAEWLRAKDPRVALIHEDLQSESTPDTEVFVGALHENGVRAPGHFVSIARLDADGRIRRYFTVRGVEPGA